MRKNEKVEKLFEQRAKLSHQNASSAAKTEKDSSDSIDFSSIKIERVISDDFAD